MPCPACTRLFALAAGHDPLYIASLRESVVMLHAHQRWRGWCVLWLRDHAEHLHELNNDRQQRLWHDVADVARAVANVTACRRINYENLGNVVNHVHWHVIPRFEAGVDPDPGAPVWVRPKPELECGVADDVRDDLVERIAAELGLHYHPE